MGWFDSLFGDADEEEAEQRKPRDPLGRLPPEPEFDAFRSAWKAGAKLFDLFGDDPVTIKQPVGPEAPNRRADVAKVETFLGRTGHLDVAKTEGPTGYYGSRVDAGIRGFQKDNTLRVDGLINPDGPTLQRIGETLSDDVGDGARRSRTPDVAHFFMPLPKHRSGINLDAVASSHSSLTDRIADWGGRRASTAQSGTTSSPLDSRGAAPEASSVSPDSPRSTPPSSARAEPTSTGNGVGRSAAPVELSGAIQVAEYDGGVPNSGGTSAAPTLNREADRVRSILEDTPATFDIADDHHETGGAPVYRLDDLGVRAVDRYGAIVEREASKQGVDPDIVKAILYYENADGHKFGLDELSDMVGRSRSQRPMSIRSDKWGSLGVSRDSNPEENIRASITLIKRLSERIQDPTPEKLGTLWNSISQESVTDKGARIGKIYREKQWIRRPTGHVKD